MAKIKNSINMAEFPEIKEIAEKENIPVDVVVKNALRKYMGERDESKVDKWIRIITELVESAETGKKVLRYNTTQSTLAILDYLKSSGQEFIYPDEPLFQCKYGGKILKYHIMNIFDEIEEPINTKDVNKMSFNFFFKKSLHWVMINKEIEFLQEGE